MPETTYYTRLSGQIQGPYTVSELLALALRGKFGAGHQVSLDQRTWKAASSLTSLLPPSPAGQGIQSRSSASQAPPAPPDKSSDLPGWRKLQRGLFLLSLSYYCHISVALVVPLLLFLPLPWLLRRVISAQVLAAVLAYLPILLFFGCWLLEAAGLGYCIGAPREVGGKKLSIPALILSFVTALLVLGVNLFLLPAAPLASFLSSMQDRPYTLLFLTLSLLGVFSLIRLALIVGFLRRVGGCLHNEDLVKHSQRLDWLLTMWIGFLVPGQIFGFLVLGYVVLPLVSETLMVYVVPAVVVGGIALLALNPLFLLGWFIWYLEVLHQTRLAIRNSFAAKESSPLP